MRLTLILLVALAACDPPPQRVASTPGDSARQAISDSLYAEEMRRRATAAAERAESSPRYERLNEALWDLSTKGDWQAAHDTVLVEAISLLVVSPAGPSVHPASEGAPLPAFPVSAFRDGLPRQFDPYARAVDSLASRYRVADRVRVRSVPEAPTKRLEVAGFGLYTLRVRTVLEARGDPGPFEPRGTPPTYRVLLAVRDGQAQVLGVWKDPAAGLALDTPRSPLGDVVVAAPLFGEYAPDLTPQLGEVFERVGSRWRHLGGLGDLRHDRVPLFGHAFRGRAVDLEAMELRSHVHNFNGRYVGCLVSPLVRRAGRLATAPTVWRRDVETCDEYVARRGPAP